MNKEANRPLLGTLVACTLLMSSSMAISAEKTGSFMDCGPIEDDAERLACFDRAYDSRLQGQSNEDTPALLDAEFSATPIEPAPIADDPSGTQAIEKAQAEAVFGFPRPTYPDELEVLESRVIKFDRTSRNQLLFYLENGQVWIQSQTRSYQVPDEPLLATITPGVFGAFFLTLEGRKQRMKVKRIR